MNNNQDQQYINLKDLWDIFLGNIWIFAASIIVCVAIAVGYVAVTPPTYMRTASILIKDDSKGQSISSTGGFENMGLVQSNTDINNEIHILSTPQIMEEVVRRLSLQYNYGLKYKNIRWIDLYHAAPFRVELDSALLNDNVSFNLTTDGENQYAIENLVVNGNQTETKKHRVFGEPVVTSFGSFTVNKGVVIPDGVEGNLYSFSKSSVEAVASGYIAAFSARLRSTDATIIDLSITLGSTHKAEDILNTLISVYNENWIKDKNLVTLSTTNFINERLSIIEQELGVVDQNISTYKSENLLPDVGAVTGINLQSSNEILNRQIDLNNQLSMARYLLQYMQNASTSEQLLPVNSGIGSSAIDGQIVKYNELLLQKNMLLANSSRSNPVVADMIADLEALKDIMILSVNDLITTLTIQIENTRLEELAAQKRLSNNPSQELYLLSTGREQMIKEELYLFLLQKREENELNQAFTAYNTKVLSLAKGSNAPIAPQKKVILLFGFAIGCILPIVFLILKAGFNTAIEDRGDLKGLSIPYLGSIPLINHKRSFWAKITGQKAKRPRNNVVTINNSRDGINEAFRVIRTNLDFMTAKDKSCNLVSITSFNPQSGKSFISLNMAMSMATKNSRTLVVDGDFRRGTLSQAIKSPKKGLVNYLNNSVETLDEVIVKNAFHPMLDVLPMGITPPNPTELLLIERFEAAIAELQQKYDYIFFDCPPIEIVPDATIIEKYCDSTVFVIRAGLMDKRLLPELEELYVSKKLKNMSIVVNGVDHNRNVRYGYSRYGGYGKYGYGGYGSYGYGNAKSK